MINGNARIGLNSTVRHYKTKCNIKILPNIHNFRFCGALCAPSFILRLCAQSAPKNKILTFAPLPSEKWIDAPDAMCIPCRTKAGMVTAWRTPQRCGYSFNHKISNRILVNSLIIIMNHFYKAHITIYISSLCALGRKRTEKRTV